MIKIHPEIDKLNIDNDVKQYFTTLELYDIIEDSILHTYNSDIDEARENQWGFRLELNYCRLEDIKEFYYSVINSRRNYILKNKLNFDFIFYTWHDFQAGDLRFSLIPKNWSKLYHNKELPFGCAINKVNSLDTIIQNYIDDEFKGEIPINIFTKLDPLKYNDEDEIEEKFILDVWSINL